jgi:hypothetical protein
MNVLKMKYALVLAIPLFALSACNDEDESPSTQGEASIEVTDAPIDNPEVEAVFVTVTDVKVDGQSFSGFSGPKTINLLALQNGKTELLGSGALAAKSYSNLSLVLDVETDADGNSPGSYLQTADGTKHRLAAEGENTVELIASEAYEVKEEGESKLVVDVNLRQAIQSGSSGAAEYSFASAADLNNAVRVVNKERTGTIKGNYDGGSDSGTDDKIVVYAYEKGSFDAASETSGEMKFKNAVTSALVSKSSLDSDFTLAFLEEGTYELHFAHYSDDDGDGKLTFKSMLDVSSNTSASLDAIEVTAGASITLDLLIGLF